MRCQIISATLLNPQTLDLVPMSRPARRRRRSAAISPAQTAERREFGAVSVFRVRVAAGDRFAEGVTVGRRGR